MPMQALSRYLVALFLVALLSGCAGSDKSAKKTTVPLAIANECGIIRSSCIYEGDYESGERDYAEQEARRLNNAQSIRLVHSSWQ